MNVGPNSTSASGNQNNIQFNSSHQRGYSSLEGDMSNKFKKKNGRLIQDNIQGPNIMPANKNMVQGQINNGANTSLGHNNQNRKLTPSKMNVNLGIRGQNNNSALSSIGGKNYEQPGKKAQKINNRSNTIENMQAIERESKKNVKGNKRASSSLDADAGNNLMQQ